VEALPVLTEKLKTISSTSDPDQDIHVISAFRALGAEARPAVPGLIELLAPSYDAAHESPSEPEAQLNDRKSVKAALALKAIGGGSVSPLIEALEAEDVKIRFGAAMALEYFPRDAKRTVPCLVKALEDQDRDVRWRAARTIGALRALPELSVPALSKRLRDDPTTNVRCYAINALAKFGSTAAASIPDLRKAATDPNSAIRSYAQAALKKVDNAAVENMKN
jgi:HEAT repeat protein